MPDLGGNPPQFTSMAYLQRGWAQFQADPGPVIGFTAVSIGISLVLGVVPLGSIVSAVIGGPLFAGYYLVGLQRARGQSVVFADFFRGFTRFADFFLINLLIGLVTFLACLPGVLVLIAGAAFSAALPDSLQTLIGVLGALVVLLLIMAPVLYLSVSYVLAIPMVADRPLRPWLAMETCRRHTTGQWFQVLGMLLLIGLVNLVGLLPCGLGLLVTVPWSYATILAAYEDQFGLAADAAG